MRSRNSAFVLFAAVLLVFGAVAAPVTGFAEETEITCRVESPSDGSFWIGTKDNGLFRLGRNGRTIRYSAQGGQLGSDSICALVFDNQKTLWILDGSGSFRTYSSVRGFLETQNFPEGILTASQGKDENSMLFATSDKLFELDFNTSEIREIASLPIAPQQILNSQEVDEIWVFGINGVFKCSYDGSVKTWEDVPTVSNLLPFVFDTNKPSTSVRSDYLNSIWWVIIVALLAFTCGLFLNITPRPRSEQIVEKKDQVSLTTTIKAVKSEVNNDGAFTKKVKELIKENISDPDFDVEAIARLTGLSRIHVNRKLQAEGSPSPSSMIKDARMSMAMKLLKQGDLTVSQVSVQCGFRTPSYFATSFKDYNGISPSDFLENHRG